MVRSFKLKLGERKSQCGLMQSNWKCRPCVDVTMNPPTQFRNRKIRWNFELNIIINIIYKRKVICKITGNVWVLFWFARRAFTFFKQLFHLLPRLLSLRMHNLKLAVFLQWIWPETFFCSSYQFLWEFHDLFEQHFLKNCS